MEREEVSTRPRYENVKDNDNGLHQGSRGGVSKAHLQGKTRSDSTSSMNPGAPRQVRFHVAFCSGEDPEFPAEELNVHSPQTRGWQSPAFCAYPQEIGLEFLEGEVQLSQLQILSHESKIATKIDVYVGRGDDYSTCSFKRLGHLSLDNNERSDFAARELKSVYVGKQGNFLKLLIHKCHLNRHNIYNQAGVIAINVLGLSVPPGQSYASGEQGSRYVAPVPKSVPPLQDLAFDMNFDKETAETMRQLHQVKERAVQDEDFEFAKEIKHAEDQLKQLGVQVAGLENAKRSAVQREDYDEASAVKHEIQAIRADIAGLTAHLLGTNLNNGGNRSTRMQNGGMHDLAHMPNNRGGGVSNGQLMESIVPNGNQLSDSIGSNGREPETAGQHAPSHIPSLPHIPGQPQMQAQQQPGFGFQPAYASPGHETPTHQNYIGEDERPLPVLQKSPGQHSARSFHGNRSGSAIPTSFPGNAVQEELVDGEANATDPEVIAKALHSVPGYEDLPEAETLPVGLANETQPLVDVFDEYLVRCLYSRQVKLRSAALTALENRIDEYSMPEPRIFAAFVSVCRLVVNDKNTNVYLQGIKVLELVIARASSLKRSDMQSLEPLARPIVEKLGNNTSRLRVASEAALMNMAHQRNIGPQFVANSVLRPTRQGKTLLWRLLLGRVRVVSELVREYGMRDELGLGLETVMEYVRANNALAHPHAEVRETTKELLMQAYTHVGEAVMPYLTDLRPKQLEEYQLGFQELDGGVRVTSETRKDIRSSPKHQKPRQQQAPNSARSGRSSARSTSRAGTQSPTNRDINININVSHDQEGQATAAGDENLDLEEVEPFTCQFCERHDPSFTEDALDMHYWKECPMLTSCVQCEQVIEVALLNDHLLHECENKDNHKKCPRCNEAIASQFLDQHVQRGTCLVSKPLSQANRCPLCHEDFKPGPEGWKEHILAGKGCPKNPRTLYLR